MLRGLSDPYTGVLLRIQSEGRTFTKHKNKDKARYGIRCKKKRRIGVTEGQQVKEEAFQRMISGRIASKSMSE